MYARRSLASLDRFMKIGLAILAVALAAGVGGQEKPKIAVRVNLVTLFATVHDSDGRVGKNLTRDDFVLLEDGVPQKIDFFSQESDLPLTLGLRRAQVSRSSNLRKADF